MYEYRALSAYRGERAHGYDATRFGNLKGRLVDVLEWRLIRRGLRNLGWTPADASTILDAPVGTGRMASRLAVAGATVIGADVSEDMIEVARSKGAAQEYVVGRCESLPLADDAVDYVVCLRLFGHLPQDAKRSALREFARVARRGLVICFAADTPWLNLRRSAQRRLGRPLESWWPLRPDEAEAMALECGAHDVEVLRLTGPMSETHALVLSLADKRVPDGAGNGGDRGE